MQHIGKALMTPQEARAQYNFLMTLCIRKEESFGPLALTFIREHDFEQLGLTPEEQFNLYMATAETFAPEPKRYTHKLECLQKANDLLPRTRFWEPGLARQLLQDIQKTSADLEIYNQAMRVPRAHDLKTQRLIVETEAPEYFLDLAQKRAAAYYQNKYRLPQEAKTAQHFGGTPKKFEPENETVQKEFPGACAPFMNARMNAFHLMLPFDLKISRSRTTRWPPVCGSGTQKWDTRTRCGTRWISSAATSATRSSTSPWTIPISCSSPPRRSRRPSWGPWSARCRRMCPPRSASRAPSWKAPIPWDRTCRSCAT